MKTKKIISIFFMAVLLASCAHEKYEVDPITGINPGDIRDTLRDNVSKFRRCYESQLDSSKTPRELEANATFKFVVNEKGSVGKSEVKSSDIQSAQALICMKNILEGLKFPAAINAKSYEVTQPMNFYPPRS
ncbi:AgmX/PglI C-terminal domain-containing protein [Bacteriovorax sp. PP10]|uniref:AgmX/PglI C-terminal domain-containing protein n=1 Tax=Bacteriovorax antarcticus TaxID=3088717 RepID=A0ABU5W3H6_9BACT|nr:AgmX/PglI C-terminal domain-containing protein [Bacteriovorax sp. PP10]MEA9358350.1 AgmX/PglI C-terminal domain-containing protein [Bacteriovorax sp. PP10]